MDDVPYTEECDQHDWLVTLTVLLSAMLETSIDCSSAWFLGHTQKSLSYHQWRLYTASLVQFEDTKWCPGTPECFWSSFEVWHNFCTDFQHAQIFRDNLASNVLFHVMITSNHMKSQLIFTACHLPYPLDIDFSPAGWRCPTPRVIFHLLVPLFEPLVLLKICTQYSGIWPSWLELQNTPTVSMQRSKTPPTSVLIWH